MPAATGSFFYRSKRDENAVHLIDRLSTVTILLKIKQRRIYMNESTIPYGIAGTEWSGIEYYFMSLVEARAATEIEIIILWKNYPVNLLQDLSINI